jgi:RNA recognition motif-containing protein
MSKTRLFFAPLPRGYNEEQIKAFLLELFTPYEAVTEDSFILITDRETGRLKPFCFVELEAEAAEKAMADIDQATTEEDITLTLNVAQAKPAMNKGGARRPSTGGFRPAGPSNGGFRSDRR